MDHFLCPPISSHMQSSQSPPYHLCPCSHPMLANLLPFPYSFPHFLQLYLTFSLIPHCSASSSSHASVFLAVQEAAYAPAGSELRVCCPMAACTCCSGSGAMQGWATLSSPPSGHPCSTPSPAHSPAFYLGVKYLWDCYFCSGLGKNSLTASGAFAGWGGRQEDRQPPQLHSLCSLENQAKN